MIKQVGVLAVVIVVSVTATDKRDASDPVTRAVADLTAYRSQMEDTVRFLRSHKQQLSSQYAALRTAYDAASKAVNLFYEQIATTGDASDKTPAADGAVAATKAVDTFVMAADAALGGDKNAHMAAPPLVHLAIAWFDSAHSAHGQKNAVKAKAIAEALVWQGWDGIR
jgi:hypothetical protein